MRHKLITLFICITIVIGAMVVTKYYIEDDQCIAVGMYSRGIIVDQNNEPISNVKIYEDSIESKDRSISNEQVNLKLQMAFVVTLRYN